MKKTVQVNIGGQPFHVDEDAYQRLQNYLQHIKAYYAKTPEGEEIIQDIEARIAEILIDKISKTKQSVSLEDISTVLLILGEPEQFDDQELHHTTTTHAEKPIEAPIHINRRRIFRNEDNAKLGGVCSGLASYLGVKPIFARIFFAVATFFYGASFLLYILLWFMVPVARTRAEKLEMHGDSIDISSIERTIKQEFNNLKKNVGI